MITSRWKRNVVPPTVPSELLTMGLRDLSWVEKHGKYKINMYTWASECEVCFAGSVMVRRFHHIPGCGPNHYSRKWNDAFYALNAFRLGDVTKGLEHMDIYRTFECIHVPPYWHYPGAFKRCMEDLVTRLRREGL